MTRAASWAAWSVAAVVAVLHLATAGRYDAFVNELYFIVCGRHPAFGYVDQPPLVPLISAVTQLAGTNIWLLRLPAVAAAVFLVPLTVAFAQLLGARTRGAWLAAIAAAAAPMLTAMTATLGTSTFEAVAWTGIAYLIARAALRREPHLLLWAGVVTGFAFEAKYGVLIWIAGLAVGLATSSDRTLFRTRELWAGVGIAVLLAAPNVTWQAAHGLPFAEAMHNDNAGNLTGTPLYFALNQAFTMNIVLAPLWLTGIIAPFAVRDVARWRFLSIAFVVAALTVYLTHGKSYYLAGGYPSLFAVGAAACSRLPIALVAVWSVLAGLQGALALPFVLPVVQPERLEHMLEHLSFKPKPVEVQGYGAPLGELFSEEFGWRELAADVTKIYADLPATDRSHAAIFAQTYGEAGAIDVFGVGLPPALSGENQYYLWGPRGYDGSVVIAVNVDPAQWSRLCKVAHVIGTYGSSPYAMPHERDRPIVLCRGMHPPLTVTWPAFRHYGLW